MTPSETLAIYTNTFDATYLIQICSSNGVLVTVGTPAGPGGAPTTFCIWDGEGIDEEGDEDVPYKSVLVTNDVEASWRETVRQAYEYAVERLFNG